MDSLNTDTISTLDPNDTTEQSTGGHLNDELVNVTATSANSNEFDEFIVQREYRICMICHL